MYFLPWSGLSRFQLASAVSYHSVVVIYCIVCAFALCHVLLPIYSIGFHFGSHCVVWIVWLLVLVISFFLSHWCIIAHSGFYSFRWLFPLFQLMILGEVLILVYNWLPGNFCYNHSNNISSSFAMQHFNQFFRLTITPVIFQVTKLFFQQYLYLTSLASQSCLSSHVLWRSVHIFILFSFKCKL